MLAWQASEDTLHAGDYRHGLQHALQDILFSCSGTYGSRNTECILELLGMVAKPCFALAKPSGIQNLQFNGDENRMDSKQFAQLVQYRLVTPS